jgi:hypothetical protein
MLAWPAAARAGQRFRSATGGMPMESRGSAVVVGLSSIVGVAGAVWLGGCDGGHANAGAANPPHDGTPREGSGACRPGWLTPPPVDPSIAVPADGGGLRIHVAASGTQNYACTATDAGTAWTLLGPQATLDDCTGAVFGHHFPSDAGASAPEWQASDGTYVVAHKVAAFTPDGGAGSVPWLLLGATAHGGSGTLAQSTFVQRVDTQGGVAAAGACDAGATQNVKYTADYYFYGP